MVYSVTNNVCDDLCQMDKHMYRCMPCARHLTWDMTSSWFIAIIPFLCFFCRRLQLCTSTTDDSYVCNTGHSTMQLKVLSQEHRFGRFFETCKVIDVTQQQQWRGKTSLLVLLNGILYLLSSRALWLTTYRARPPWSPPWSCTVSTRSSSAACTRWERFSFETAVCLVPSYCCHVFINCVQQL